MWLAYIGPGPGFAVQAPALILFFGMGAALLVLLTYPFRLLLRRPRKRGPAKTGRVVVVGLDGLEPTLLEAGMQEGWLPHFQSLADSGGYQRLATTCPPLSPVAWSTFSTGVNPGKHGIFGFLHRTRDFRPYLAFSKVVNGRPVQLRKSKSFWTVLGEHGVFSHVLRVPVTWPAEPFHGAMLSAMGVPDMRGTQGTYTLFGTTPEKLLEGEFVPFVEGCARLQVEGAGTLELRLDAQGELRWAKQSLALEVGRYSPWVELPLGKATALVRFLLLQLEPTPRLYMTPMQIDPERPAMPVSSPAYYSVALAKLLGKYATCGLAEDTGGREDHVLSQAAFLEQCYSIHEERERQFFHALERTGSGLCLAVFDGPDRIQHMAMDDPAALREMYSRMDNLLGRVKSQLRPDDLLIVLSDHGFKPLTRMFDVNAWLKENGYLHLLPDGAVDWSRTRAYAVGLAGIHLNLQGRDEPGIVPPTDVEPLKTELRERLTGLQDRGQTAIVEVFEAAKIYQGPYLDRAPDLVIGYEVGYRISKPAARGEVGDVIFADNDSQWCGDHCLHPGRVPGVLLANRSFLPEAHLRDLAPTILDALGVRPPAYMEGKCLLAS